MPEKPSYQELEKRVLDLEISLKAAIDGAREKEDFLNSLINAIPKKRILEQGGILPGHEPRCGFKPWHLPQLCQEILSGFGYRGSVKEDMA